MKKTEIKRIFLKVNSRKLDENKKIIEQVWKITNYLKERNGIECDIFDWQFGLDGDDFANEKQTLMIKFIKLEHDSKN